jgi:hypothetical protein
MQMCVIFYFTHNILSKILVMVFDKLVELVIKKYGVIPRIYYLGIGKTGSSSICGSFDEIVAHWHHNKHVDKTLGTLLCCENNIDLLKLIIYIGKKFNFKPLIIEGFRNPVSRSISSYFENNAMSDETKHLLINNPNITLSFINVLPSFIKNLEKLNINILNDFDKNKNYYYKEFSECTYFVYKFEKINTIDFSGILGCNFQIAKLNTTKNKSKTLNELYIYCKLNVILSDDVINEINELHYYLKYFYDYDELKFNNVNIFKEKF